MSEKGKYMFARSISSQAIARQMRKAPLPIIITLTTVALFAIGIGARAWHRSSDASGAAKSLKTQGEPSQGGGQRVHLESELITIGPGGFEPSTIRRPAGRFFLAIENRSGLDSVTLRIDRLAGNRLKEAAVSGGQLDWIDVLDLTPGDYVVTEADHPNWVCYITVTPN
jgi:hypothetical protein